MKRQENNTSVKYRKSKRKQCKMIGSQTNEFSLNILETQHNFSQCALHVFEMRRGANSKLKVPET